MGKSITFVLVIMCIDLYALILFTSRFMLDILYYFAIISCLIMGVVLLLIRTTPTLQDKHYRVTKRFLGVASIIVAVGEAVILLKKGSGLEVEMFSAPVLIIAQLQAALFTFAVLTLFHSRKVNQRYILKCLIPTFVFAPLYALSVILFSDVNTHSIEEHLSNLTNPSLVLRTIFGVVYLVQIAIYVRLFRRERKIYIAKIENYFSDTDSYKLNWATRLFYEATGLGLVVFVFSMFPHMVFDAVLTVAIACIYIIFAVEYINYQYRLYYALPAVKDEPEKVESVVAQQKDPSLEEAIAKHPLFLKQGVVLADYASALDITERKFSSYINSTYGVNFNRWINLQRVEYAKKLAVENPELNIELIAEKSGFANKSHFSRTFKEIEGVLFIEHKNT